MKKALQITLLKLSLKRWDLHKRYLQDEQMSIIHTIFKIEAHCDKIKAKIRTLLANDE